MSWQELTVSRRGFMQGAALAGGALALGSGVPRDLVEYREGLQPLTNAIEMDFLSPYSTRGNPRYSYVSALNQAKQLLGPYYIAAPCLIAEFGPGVFAEEPFKKKVMAKYPEYGLVMGGMLSFTDHGYKVLGTHERFAQTYGYQALPEYISVQEGLSVINLHHTDPLGNPAVLMNLSVEPMIHELHKHPDQAIVNISLQVGTFAVIHKRRNIQTVYEQPYAEEEFAAFPYDIQHQILRETMHLNQQEISPFYEIQGAYTGEFGQENISELLRMVKEFSQKLFVMAAGNYGDDLRAFRETVGDGWPDNVLIVGHWDREAQYPRMYGTYSILGADIYVDALAHSTQTGSSMATAQLSAAASILHEMGIPILEIKQLLFACCDEVEIETQPYIPFGSTNVEDYIYAQLNKKKETVRVFNEAHFQSLLTQQQHTAASVGPYA